MAVVVVDRLLQERVADAVRHAAVLLAVDDHGIEGHADVVDDT